MKFQFLLLLFFALGFIKITAQSVPSVEEVQNFLSNQNILLTYREGEAVYGTYYFVDIHYCPNGYGLYGRSEKQTVLGNVQRNSWREFGTWEVIEQNGTVGVYTVTTTGQQNFTPVYKLASGDFFIAQGITIVKQGPAICQ